MPIHVHARGCHELPSTSDQILFVTKCVLACQRAVLWCESFLDWNRPELVRPVHASVSGEGPGILLPVVQWPALYKPHIGFANLHSSETSTRLTGLLCHVQALFCGHVSIVGRPSGVRHSVDVSAPPALCITGEIVQCFPAGDRLPLL